MLPLVFTSAKHQSQTTRRGKVTDANTGEPLIGATIIYGKGKGTATDCRWELLYFFAIWGPRRA